DVCSSDLLAGRVGIIDGGRLIAEGTPRELKARVGDPTLTVAVADPTDAPAAAALLAAFGRMVPARSGAEGAVAARLRGGAAVVAAVVRALDEAGIAVAGLDLEEPTLDDVFIAATGRRLRAEDADEPGGE